MSEAPLCLPVTCWPSADRERWERALSPAGFLEASRPASTWSLARRRIAEQAYGQWLSFLTREGLLDGSPPGERVTDDRLRTFVQELSQRVAPASASMMVGALSRMLDVIEPDRDWAHLRMVYNHLKRTAVPSRDKLGHMVRAVDLLELGVRLMDSCGEVRSQPIHVATQFRDGLLIAMLICCPVRIKNIAMIEIGDHLTFDGSQYLLQFSREEVKTGTAYAAALPLWLTPCVDSYLETHRPALQLIAHGKPCAASGPLWMNRWGRIMKSSAIREQIKARTKHAFGKPVWPHLFRDCAATELVDIAPDQIGIAPDVLGHRSLATTQKHYIRATGMGAHRAVQDMLARARRAARERPGKM